MPWRRLRSGDDAVDGLVEGVVVDRNEKGVVVQLIDFAVVARATGRAEEGTTVQVRVDAAEIETGKLALSVVS